MKICGYFLIAIISYLLGNISTSYIISKKISGVDIRTQGSGNAGSTNVLRTHGIKAGVATFLGDVLKGLLSVIIAGFIGSLIGINIEIAKYLAVVFVVCGHNWPVFMGFRGGKGVATSLGSMIAIAPVISLICLGIFILVVLLTKYVSLGSILAIACSIVAMSISENRNG
ncbi:MAG: glycerol-3-phosphate 1-O-acyltransferase PlsY, partial [Clostridioides sp.]|nr:glycerol-3-phosphate 1-O-acyltransferase PlsY [Clostridioides sp.]